MKTLTLTLATGSVLALTVAAAATDPQIVGYENFDGGAINLIGTSNVFDYGAGGGSGGDVFGRMSKFDGGAGTGGPFDAWDDSVEDTSGGGMFAGDSRGIAGRNTSAFFGMVDSDGNIDGAGNNLNNAVWSFDISSATAITSIDMDIAAMGDFEESSTDGFLVEAQIDGGGWVEIFKGRTFDDAGNHSYTYRPMDGGSSFSENDPLELYIDSVATGTLLDKADAASGDFDSYSSVGLAGASGNQLEIRISWAGSPSGGEAMGFDNFTVVGKAVPAPGALALLALAGVAARRRRRG